MNLDDFLFLFYQGSCGGDGGENVRGDVASDVLHFQPFQSLNLYMMHASRGQRTFAVYCTPASCWCTVLVHELRT
jgi:hypothetical protein